MTSIYTGETKALGGRHRGGPGAAQALCGQVPGPSSAVPPCSRPGGPRRGRGRTCFCSWLSWADRLSMRMRDCCSSSWAAPTRLLFLSADCLALSSWGGGGTKG